MMKEDRPRLFGRVKRSIEAPLRSCERTNLLESKRGEARHRGCLVAITFLGKRAF